MQLEQPPLPPFPPASHFSAFHASPNPLASLSRPWFSDPGPGPVRLEARPQPALVNRRTGPPSHRVGRHVRYEPTEVRAWVLEQG